MTGGGGVPNFDFGAARMRPFVEADAPAGTVTQTNRAVS